MARAMVGAIIGASISVGLEIVAQLTEKNVAELDIGKIGIAALGGAITGSVGGAMGMYNGLNNFGKALASATFNPAIAGISTATSNIKDYGHVNGFQLGASMTLASFFGYISPSLGMVVQGAISEIAPNASRLVGQTINSFATKGSSKFTEKKAEENRGRHKSGSLSNASPPPHSNTVPIGEPLKIEVTPLPNMERDQPPEPESDNK